jgi:predicted flap endonuclease-1-like 5' DNA nuclease
MSYPVTAIEGIGPDEAAALRKVGIRTSVKLLEAAKNPKGRKQLAEKTGIDEKRLLECANMADRMRVKGIGGDYAKLLRVVGVNTVRELKHRNAEKLARAMAEANAKRRLVQFLPSQKAVARWIDHAKKLPPKITY